MSRTALLQTLSPIMLVLAGGLLGSRRRLIRRIITSGATSRDAAATVNAPGLLTRWWLARLGAAKVLHSAERGQYWLDLAAWQRYRSVRRRRALMVIAGVLMLWAAFMVFGRQ